MLGHIAVCCIIVATELSENSNESGDGRRHGSDQSLGLCFKVIRVIVNVSVEMCSPITSRGLNDVCPDLHIK